MSDHPKVSIHHCLLFAEEFLKVAHLTRVKTGDPFIDAFADPHRVQVLKSTIQPAEMEFMGRELTSIERAFLAEGVSTALNPNCFHHECSAFTVAHIVFHAVNGFEGSEHE